MQNEQYPMPAMTEQERQVLIADCEEDIKMLKVVIARCEANKIFSRMPLHKRDLCTRQIALAALTAKPVFYRSIGGASGRECLDRIKPKNTDSQPLYTAPPVQVLRPVELPRPYGMQDHEKWLNQKEVVSAIRAAGYEVKE